MKLLVTGGAGFIGSAVVRHIILNTKHEVINVDCLTYAGNLQSLYEIESSDRYYFEQVDIADSNEIANIFAQYQPDAVMHLAAESHVDRSIDDPARFIRTNIEGTYVLLDKACSYFENLDAARKSTFRFHHVSTDEVYGSLGKSGSFSESSPYLPNSPYSASKASSDHLVRAWFETYSLPVVISNCSNNYGPYQYPEKLIPTLIINALSGKKLPIYGDGMNVRDWLYVDDHVSALMCVLQNGKSGETYNIGGSSEKTNIEIANSVCAYLDAIKPKASGRYADQIEFVTDRPGHDRRYAIDNTKIISTLSWKPKMTFDNGIKQTVEWYINNIAWIEGVIENSNALKRVGLG